MPCGSESQSGNFKKNCTDGSGTEERKKGGRSKGKERRKSWEGERQSWKLIGRAGNVRRRSVEDLVKIALIKIMLASSQRKMGERPSAGKGKPGGKRGNKIPTGRAQKWGNWGAITCVGINK